MFTQGIKHSVWLSSYITYLLNSSMQFVQRHYQDAWHVGRHSLIVMSSTLSKRRMVLLLSQVRTFLFSNQMGHLKELSTLLMPNNRTLPLTWNGFEFRLRLVILNYRKWWRHSDWSEVRWHFEEGLQRKISYSFLFDRLYEILSPNKAIKYLLAFYKAGCPYCWIWNRSGEKSVKSKTTWN